MAKLDPHLRFGLWPVWPAWLTRPVMDELGGRALSEVTTREASSVVERVGVAQGVRAPVVAVPPLVVAALLDRAGISGAWAEAMWVLTLMAVLVLPTYMTVVGVLHWRLRRSSHQDQLVATAHPRVLRALRAAPGAAIALAFAGGVVLH